MAFYLSLIAAASLVLAESPQEHSHDLIVIQVKTILQQSSSELAKFDPIYGLLDADDAFNAAKNSKLSEPFLNDACLQQYISDECITTVKTKNLDKNSLSYCLLYRALERNSEFGKPSKVCSETPKNPEIASIKQHQDPNSEKAAEWNSQVEVEVGKAILKLGFTTDQAIHLAHRTATFSSSQANNGAGNSCNSFPGWSPVAGDQKEVPQVYATGDGKKETKDVISGRAFGIDFTAGQLIDCVTLAELRGDTKHMVVPALSLDKLRGLLDVAGSLAPINPPPATPPSASVPLPVAPAAPVAIPVINLDGNSPSSSSMVEQPAAAVTVTVTAQPVTVTAPPLTVTTCNYVTTAPPPTPPASPIPPASPASSENPTIDLFGR